LVSAVALCAAALEVALADAVAVADATVGVVLAVDAADAVPVVCTPAELAAGFSAT
jgi:hypothetical protein